MSILEGIEGIKRDVSKLENATWTNEINNYFVSKWIIDKSHKYPFYTRALN